MIWTTCKYAPEELFKGFGEEVRRLDPNPVSFSCADGCAHPNLCGFAKAVIEEVKERGIRRLVFTDCCDAMRRTYDVLAREEMEFLYMLPLPHKTGDREIRLFASSLRALKASYEKASGCRLSVDQAVKACRASMTEESGSSSYTIRVCGAHGGHMLLEETRRLMPGISLRDDTCSGNRHFQRVVPEDVAEDADWGAKAADMGEEEFFLRYARQLLMGMDPCMRMYDTAGRLKETCEDPSLRGIIYHTIKFCDYYSFEYADLRQRAAVPILKLETDTTPQSSGQLKTRLEAFYETLGGETMLGGDRRRKDRKRESGGDEAGKREDGPLYVAGIDSGSTSTDAVILNEAHQILGSAILPTGMSASGSAEEALQVALKEAGLTREELTRVVATGYGRDSIEMDKRTVTEITCHARGAHVLFPDARTIIDIGGQDSKVIRIDEEGNVLSFVMNDKCAAGTGRFLEMQAKALGLTLREMSERGLHWRKEVQISNMCTVFAESEVVSLVAADTAVEDIIHGLNESVAAKTVSLIRRGKGEADYCMTGGVSRNQGVVRCLEEKLGTRVQVLEASQLCGAIGAAILGFL